MFFARSMIMASTANEAEFSLKPEKFPSERSMLVVCERAKDPNQRNNFIFPRRNLTSLSSFEVSRSSRTFILWANLSGVIRLYWDSRVATAIPIRFFVVWSIPTWARAWWIDDLCFSLGDRFGWAFGKVTTRVFFFHGFLGGWSQSIDFRYFETSTKSFPSRIAKTTPLTVFKMSFDFISGEVHFSSGPSKCFGACIFGITLFYHALWKKTKNPPIYSGGFLSFIVPSSVWGRSA